MNLPSVVRLLTLSAIWGSSFLFMRIGAPILGPVVLIASRVALAAVLLLAVSAVLKRSLPVREHWRHFLVLGAVNSAFPFLLFAIAAKTLSASLLSILNATAPLWAAVIGAAWTRTPLRPKALIGLVLGIVGVGVLMGFDPSFVREGSFLAIGLGLVGGLSYGVASTYAKTAKQADAFSNAHGSMWAATLLMAPAAPFFSHAVTMTPRVSFVVLALGLMCTGIAYLLYFRLIADVGAASALTVTFLVPVFGVLWGHLFLDEPVRFSTLVGATIVLAGTALVTGFSISALRPRAGPQR